MSQITERLERRAARRVSVDVPAVVRVNGRSRPCEVIDLSETGVRLWLDGDLPRPRIDVTVELELDGAAVSLNGAVVRVADGNAAHEAGVTFTQLGADAQQRLRSHLAALTTS
jgi:hypothetical protein